MLIRSFKYFILSFFQTHIGNPILKRWFSSIELETESSVMNNCIFGFWHQDIFGSLVFLSLKPKCLNALVSASPDGQLLGCFLKFLGMKVVYGSSSQSGVLAFRKLIHALEKKESILITPDGPKGPPRAMKVGIIRLAAITQKPIVLVRIEYEKFWSLKSWDQFRLPKPFSRCRVVLSQPVEIPRNMDTRALIVIKEKMEIFLNGNQTNYSVEKQVA